MKLAKSSSRERLKNAISWLGVVVSLAALILGHWHFQTSGALVHAGLVCAFTLSGCLCFHWTAEGVGFRGFLHELYRELWRVSWPSRREAFHTTVVVGILCLLASVMVWLLDTMLFRIIGFATGLVG